MTNANRLTKNSGDFSTHSKYCASVASIVEDVGDSNSGRIIILHDSANDDDEFPMVFPRVFHRGRFIDDIGVHCVYH